MGRLLRTIRFEQPRVRLSGRPQEPVFETRFARHREQREERRSQGFREKWLGEERFVEVLFTSVFGWIVVEVVRGREPLHGEERRLEEVSIFEARRFGGRLQDEQHKARQHRGEEDGSEVERPLYRFEEQRIENSLTNRVEELDQKEREEQYETKHCFKQFALRCSEEGGSKEEHGVDHEALIRRKKHPFKEGCVDEEEQFRLEENSYPPRNEERSAFWRSKEEQRAFEEHGDQIVSCCRPHCCKAGIRRNKGSGEQIPRHINCARHRDCRYNEKLRQ